MGFKIKNSLTGEFEKLPILTLKGEKGVTGGVEEYNKVDYMGNKYETLKQANDANVEYAVKTAIGEFNYLDYDGQHITATDTIEGRSKSAILSGNTLVNLVNDEDKVYTLNADGTYKLIHINLHTTLEANKKYYLSYRVVTNTILEGNFGLFATDGGSHCGLHSATKTNEIGVITHIDTTTKFANKLRIFLEPNCTSGTFEVTDILLIEYQEGMENWDIPYFEGMKSVQMPGLTTVGKNLFDGKLKLAWGTVYAPTNFLQVQENKKYVISEVNGQLKGATMYCFDENKNQVTSLDGTSKTIPNGVKYIKWYMSINDGVDVSDVKIQIEEGAVATSYEPHKSNILTVNEEVELRGIGNIKDELNVATGELTQRIGEVLFDGITNSNVPLRYAGEWSTETVNTFQFKLSNSVSLIASRIITNCKMVELENEDLGMVIGRGEKGTIFIKVAKSIATIDDFNNYLKTNNISFGYWLETPIVKTVDLSDNHVYSYKDVTHYDCSSAEGSLVPTLSVKVPTDVQATIAQQRETIQTLNSENERLNQIQEALKASMLDSQVQLMNLSWDIDFEVFTLRESIAPKDSLMDSKTGSNIDKFSQAKFIIENDCPDLEKLNSQIEYYFSKDVFSQEQFEELTDLISIVKGGNGCEY